jgi:predicted MFS family arabinose efflux permease
MNSTVALPKDDQQLPTNQAILVFLAFAFAYFMSALIRAITATISPTLTIELSLQARDLGLLSGGYFLGFAAMQLPLGKWLDRFGPKKVIICFLSVAVLGCLAFAKATSFYGLLLARVFCGAGVSACLMAPLTGYRRWLAPNSQIRANSWMLMSGSMGMVASTLPVQWLMPIWGWRGIFIALAAMTFIAIMAIWVIVPAWKLKSSAAADVATAVNAESKTTDNSYAQVWSNPYIRSLIPLAFFLYGGLVAVQTLWVSPWMIKIAGYSPLEAAQGLFYINVAMLIAFWVWGSINPWLFRKKISSDRLMLRGLPISFIILAIIIIAIQAYNTPAASINSAILANNTSFSNFELILGVLNRYVWALWALYCVSCTFIALSQPAIAMAFPAELAGRALSAYNLVIFAGVFVVQWGIGLMIDGFKALGWPEVAAFQGAFGIFLLCSMASYGYFVVARPVQGRKSA